MEENNNMLSQAKESLNLIQDNLIEVNNSLVTINEISERITNVAYTWMDMQKDMHMMDLQFNAYMANLDSNLEKYKISAPIISKQLENLDNVMNRIVDKVIDMNVETELDMTNKMRMMDSLDSYIDKVATMMIKLL